MKIKSKNTILNINQTLQNPHIQEVLTKHANLIA